MQKVLVIVGPTASGKTAFGIKCAKKYNGEIISGDSIQIYKGLDIGSAKIKEEEKEGVVHHLIDIKDPKDNYSVKEFQEIARKLIDDISSRGKLPIVVGGTGLYIKALLYDYTFFDEEEKDDDFKDLSNEDIYNILLKEDPKCLEKIHVNNRKRLVRALNILKKHGTGISQIKDKQEHKLIYDAKLIGLTKPREILNEKINLRVDLMFKEGLKEEVDSLLSKGISFSDQSMQGIGYKEFKDYYDGNKTLEEVKETIKTNTRHFAKRQYTWFNNQMDIEWVEDLSTALAALDNFLC